MLAENDKTMESVRTILFDVDGVLIRPPFFFSKELERKGYTNAENMLNSYYGGNDHVPSLEGKENCEESIAPYLKAFGWEHSPREYLEQLCDFDARYLDHEFMDIIARLKMNGISCCLATDQEGFRARYLLNVMDFGSLFDAHFISCTIGSRKISDVFWSHVIKELTDPPNSIKPEEIAFFDDRQPNIDVASRCGIRAIHFKSTQGFKEDLAVLRLHQGRD